jgi:hypothetical protein
MGSFRWIAELFDLDTRAVRRRLFSGARIVLNEIFEAPTPSVSADSAEVAAETIVPVLSASPLEVMVAA